MGFCMRCNAIHSNLERGNNGYDAHMISVEGRLLLLTGNVSNLHALLIITEDCPS